MQVLALCCREYEQATRKAAGVDPLLPPFRERIVCENGFVYIDMHGYREDRAFWCGADGPVPARVLTAAQVQRLCILSGSVVFATTCYLGDDDSPLRDALFDAGAAAVIAGAGVNYATGKRPAYAARLGQFVRYGLSLGFSAERALGLAKILVLYTQYGGLARSDTMQFMVFGGKKILWDDQVCLLVQD